MAVSRNTCTAKSTPRARKNIYYLLSIIYYLKSPGCANGFCPSAPLGVTFVGCDKSNQKHAFPPRKSRPKTTLLCRACFRSPSSFAAIKALLNPTKETVWVITFPFFVCDTLQFAPYSLEKIDSLSFCTKPRLEKQLLYVFTL